MSVLRVIGASLRASGLVFVSGVVLMLAGLVQVATATHVNFAADLACVVLGAVAVLSAVKKGLARLDATRPTSVASAPAPAPAPLQAGPEE